MEIVVWLIVGLVIGGLIGALATWWISRARGGAVSVMQLKRENDKFRDEVAEHFVETARLINQMTDSYKQVFDHLSSGAEKLVDDEKLAERLPPASGQEVRLSQFGASAASSSTSADDGKAGLRSGGQKAGPGRDRASDGGSKAGNQGGNDGDKKGGTKDGNNRDNQSAGASIGRDPLKRGSGQTGASASGTAEADKTSEKMGGSQSEMGATSRSEAGNKSDVGSKSEDGSAGKGAPGSGQTAEGSRKKD